MKCEVDKSLYNVTQQRLERLLLQNRDKDSIIEDLEIKVKSLEKTVKDVNINSAKAGLVSFVTNEVNVLNCRSVIVHYIT